MKKLNELSCKEARDLIVSLQSQLEIISNDKKIKEIISNLDNPDSKVSQIEFINSIICSLLITNENAFWNIISVITQKTTEEVQDMNNLEMLEIVTDFFQIEAYRKLLENLFK